MNSLGNIVFEEQEIESARLELTSKNANYILGSDLTLTNCTLVLKVPSRRLSIKQARFIDCTFEVKHELRITRDGWRPLFRRFRAYALTIGTSMPLSPSAEDLINVVQNYYDSNNTFHFTLETSTETSRRQSLWAQWIAHMEPWLAFRDELGSKLPAHVIGETYSSHDGGPRCIIYPPDDLRTHSSDWTVVGCLSLLAPVYFIYGLERERQTNVRRYKVSSETPPPHMRLPAKIIARTIEESFGASAIPRAVADTPVQLFVGNLEPPKTTLFHALFTDEPETIP